MKLHRLMSAAVVAAAVITVGSVGGVASADMSKNVINAFKGQLIVSKTDLPEGKNDKDTIQKIKASKVTSLTGEVQEDVAHWHFHYAAFLSRTGSTKLKMEFYSGKQLAADKVLDGIDPKSALLTGEISINEDEGLTKGKTYTIKLLNGKGTVAQTTLTMK
jgi:hypothetical protein